MLHMQNRKRFFAKKFSGFSSECHAVMLSAEERLAKAHGESEKGLGNTSRRSKASLLETAGCDSQKFPEFTRLVGTKMEHICIHTYLAPTSQSPIS